LFATCGQVLKKLHLQARYVIDSFPVAVCQNVRIPRCKLLTDKVYRGVRPASGSGFTGLKRRSSPPARACRSSFTSTPAARPTSPLRAMAVELPAGSIRYTDNAYTDYALEDLFAEATGGQQVTARQKNSKRPHSPVQNFLLQHFRKGIETAFSKLTACFPKHIHAVTAAGFVLKLALFIFVHTLDKAGC
jgi:hypothetical protein